MQRSHYFLRQKKNINFLQTSKKSLTGGSKAPLKRDDSFGAQRVLGFFVNHINLFNKK